jgi:glutamine---fructose-6-phosphate transaminase (isomerizing)
MPDTNTSGLYRSIHAQPAAIRELLSDWDGPSRAAELMAQTGRIFLSGIGTSFHAAMVGEYLLRYAGADAWGVRSFEFVNYPRPLREDDGVIVVSHRGSKIHGNLAVQRALSNGVRTVGITGRDSKMQGELLVIQTVAQEISSAHSISYMGAMTRLAQIAARLAALKGRSREAQALEQGLAQLPAVIEHMLAREDEVRQVANEAAAHARRLFYIGAGPNAVTGPEGALKAKEAAYVTAEGFELEQAIHGPQVGFEAQDVVIPVCVRGPAQSRMADLLLALHEIDSRVWLVGEAPSQETAALFDGERWKLFAIRYGADVPEELTPLLTVVPLQLLADFLATARGTNADGFRADQEAYKNAGLRFKL